MFRAVIAALWLPLLSLSASAAGASPPAGRSADPVYGRPERMSGIYSTIFENMFVACRGRACDDWVYGRPMSVHCAPTACDDLKARVEALNGAKDDWETFAISFVGRRGRAHPPRRVGNNWPDVLIEHVIDLRLIDGRGRDWKGALPEPAAPKRLDWMPKIGRHDRLQLHQEVVLHGSRMEVCRTLTNVSGAAIALAPLTPGGDGSGQFTTLVFDAHGDVWREPDRGVHHPSFIPPPPPPPGGGSPPSTRLRPRESFRNCETLPTPGLPSFSLISDFLPLAFEMAELHSPIEGTRVRSNRCSIRGQQVTCDR